ncbi:hypothetical protein CFB84_29650 [Burkholderia aenigmatica]|uniref:Uncharacterized protein n=1 Tax=Burkholderia aenigmatica TaxID=2015348 RepID=A0A228I7U4_9BURK|nr:hypothetical protein CFB84_29650 [Burkholderia aenigmatica]
MSHGAVFWPHARRHDGESRIVAARLDQYAKETLINGPTSEVAGEMASNFLDDEANRRSIQ